MSCIFCEIAKGSIPSVTLYEDESVRAILDVNPASFGHALVMPKAHCTSVLDCPDEDRDKVFQTAARLARSMKEHLGCDGINILSNAGEAAGQSVNHFHVHVIPRYADDEKKDGLSISQRPLDSFDLEAIRNEIAL